MPSENRYESLPIFIATLFIVMPLVIALAPSCKKPRHPDNEYVSALYASMQPDSHISNSLVSVNLDQPVTVVALTQQAQVANYKNGMTPPKNTWVTVVPWLKAFCQNYVRSHGADHTQLNLRLAQRLGLSPSSNYEALVEFTIDPKDNFKFFRPCYDPAVNTSTCAPPSLPNEFLRDDIKNINLTNNQENEKYWFFSKYYRSFASDRKYQYPWTGLGYSFDWARKEDNSDEFVRFGESEFVVGPNTPAKFVSASDTLAYCTP